MATVTDLSDNALSELEAAVAAEKQARKERDSGVDYVTFPGETEYRWSYEKGLEFRGFLGSWRASTRSRQFDVAVSAMRDMHNLVDMVRMTRFLNYLADNGKL
jgi:rhamnogalacturonyl hydrolase YesR